MSALAKQLKDEITRVANRKVRENAMAMKKTWAQQRADNAALNKRLSALERGSEHLALPPCVKNWASMRPRQLLCWG